MSRLPPSDSDTSVFEDARDDIQAEEARMARIATWKLAQSTQLLRDEQQQPQAMEQTHALETFNMANCESEYDTAEEVGERPSAASYAASMNMVDVSTTDLETNNRRIGRATLGDCWLHDCWVRPRV